jgi:hypothetical protein
MATYTDLTNAIDNLLALSVTGQTLQLNAAVREKAFEVYAMSLIAEGVRRAGGDFRVIGINSGISPNPVVFRAAPGSIFSNRQDFAYLDCTLLNRRFEIHVDVEYQGSNNATHELDISLIDHDKADGCRRGARNPRTPIFIAECKFFSSSIPSIGQARSLVGLVSDFNVKMGSAFISNGATNNLKNYLGIKSRPDPFPDLSPLDPGSEGRLITFIETKLRKWASV